jgi:hypothetical protein
MLLSSQRVCSCACLWLAHCLPSCRAASHGTATKLPVAGAQGQIRRLPSYRRRPYLLTNTVQSLALRSQPPPAEAKGTDRSTAIAPSMPQVKEEPLDKPAGDVVGSIIYDITILPCGLIALPAPLALCAARRHLHKNAQKKVFLAHLRTAGWEATNAVRKRDGLPHSQVSVEQPEEVHGKCRKGVVGLPRDGIKEKRIPSQWSLPPVNVSAVPTDVPPGSSSLDASSAAVIQPGFVEWRNAQSAPCPCRTSFFLVSHSGVRSMRVREEATIDCRHMYVCPSIG